MPSGQPTQQPTQLIDNPVLLEEFSTDIADAAQSGSPALVSKMIDDLGGAEMLADPKKNLGYTATVGAAFLGHASVVEVLLTKGEVKVNGAGITGNTPLMWAAYAGQLDVVKMMVQSYGADPSIKNENGENAMVLAANNGHRAVMRFLEDYV
jgi:ankyrin repeat protein